MKTVLCTNKDCDNTVCKHAVHHAHRKECAGVCLSNGGRCKVVSKKKLKEMKNART